jgi:hypothetical protein
MEPVFEKPSITNACEEGGLAVICPPHHWDIDMHATNGVFFARCKKCGARTSFPAYIELDLEEVMHFGINRGIVTSPERTERVKRSNLAALRNGSDGDQIGGGEN